MKRRLRIVSLVLSLMLVIGIFAGCTAAANTQEKTFTVLDDKLDAEQLGIGFRNSDIALGNAVIDALDQMIADGTAGDISTTWFGKDILLKDAPDLESTEVPAGDDSLDKVKAAGKLIIGLDDAYPPMGFRDDDNNIVGFDVDLAKGVGEVLGIEIVFQPIDWDSKELELDSGRIDCIWSGMTISDDRLESMYIPRAYLANNQIVIVPSDSDIKTVADLAGKKIGLQKGSTSYDALAKSDVFSQIKEEDITQLADNVSVFMDLKAGRIDAFVVDEVPGRYIMSHN